MLWGVDGHIKVSWTILLVSCIDRKLTVCEVCSAILILLLPKRRPCSCLVLERYMLICYSATN